MRLTSVWECVGTDRESARYARRSGNEARTEASCPAGAEAKLFQVDAPEPSGPSHSRMMPGR